MPFFFVKKPVKQPVAIRVLQRRDAQQSVKCETAGSKVKQQRQAQVERFILQRLHLRLVRRLHFIQQVRTLDQRCENRPRYRMRLIDRFLVNGDLGRELTALSWFGWTSSAPPEAAVDVSGEEALGTRISLWILYGQSAANALGLVPAMILLVDYLSRGLGLGAGAGAAYWILFGLAGIIGPLATGYVCGRIGYRRTYRVALFLQIVALGLLAFTKNLVAIGVSTVTLGVFTVGVVQVVLGRVQDILPNDNLGQRAAWSRATVIFALFQALSAYGYAFIFRHTEGNYALIFLCGLVALVVAFAADLSGRSWEQA